MFIRVKVFPSDMSDTDEERILSLLSPEDRDEYERQQRLFGQAYLRVVRSSGVAIHATVVKTEDMCIVSMTQ